MSFPRSRRQSCHEQAFTLLELLVVAGIVAILAALAFPVLSGMKESSLETKCLGSLRQIGVAAAIWRQENDQRMVPPYNIASEPGETTMPWAERLIPYLSVADASERVDPASVLNCPNRDPLEGLEKWWQEGASYALNTFQQDAQWDFHFLKIPEPSRILHITEIVETNTEWSQTADGIPTWGAPMEFRHGERANVLFCDGHADSLAYAELELDPEGANSVWKWW